MPQSSPLPSTAQTASMLLATALAAVGLNLGVLGVGSDDTAAVDAVEASTEGTASVELLGLQFAGQAVAEPLPTAAGAPADSEVAGEVAPLRPAVSSDSAGQTLVVKDTVHGTENGSEARDDDSSTPQTTQTAPPAAAPESSPAPTTTATPVSPFEPSTTESPAEPTTDKHQQPTTERPSTSDPVDKEPAPTIAVATEYLTYEFEGVATVIVALHDGSHLEFWSATPDPGWVFRVDDNEASKVKIKFQPLDGGDEAEWELKFDDGRLKLKQEH